MDSTSSAPARKIAVFSDIHSNYHAFKACYDDALEHGADSFIFLGDYISDLAEPQKTMDLLYEIQSRYSTICLRGNREKYMLDCENGASKFSLGSKSGSLLFTYNHLRKKDLDFFQKLKISDTIEIDGIQIEIAHAAMDDDRYYFDSNDGHTSKIIQQMKCQYLLTGHSHKQYVHRSFGKTIINPGSVGIPQDGTLSPKYALLTISNGELSFDLRKVSYCLENVIHAQFASGLVNYAKYWAVGILYDIITGEEWVLKLLKSVQNEGGTHDENVWHRISIEMGMKLTEAEIMDFYLSNKS